MLELKTYNHKQYPSLYRGSTVNSKFGRFLDCQECYITYVTCAVGICLICPHSWACAYISGKFLLLMLHSYITYVTT